MVALRGIAGQFTVLTRWKHSLASLSFTHTRTIKVMATEYTDILALGCVCSFVRMRRERDAGLSCQHKASSSLEALPSTKHTDGKEPAGLVSVWVRTTQLSVSLACTAHSFWSRCFSLIRCRQKRPGCLCQVALTKQMQSLLFFFKSPKGDVRCVRCTAAAVQLGGSEPPQRRPTRRLWNSRRPSFPASCATLVLQCSVSRGWTWSDF